MAFPLTGRLVARVKARCTKKLWHEGLGCSHQQIGCLVQVCEQRGKICLGHQSRSLGRAKPFAAALFVFGKRRFQPLHPQRKDIDTARQRHCIGADFS